MNGKYIQLTPGSNQQRVARNAKNRMTSIFLAIANEHKEIEMRKPKVFSFTFLILVMIVLVAGAWSIPARAGDLRRKNGIRPR